MAGENWRLSDDEGVQVISKNFGCVVIETVSYIWRCSRSFTSRDGVSSCSELPLIKGAEWEDTLPLEVDRDAGSSTS